MSRAILPCGLVGLCLDASLHARGSAVHHKPRHQVNDFGVTEYVLGSVFAAVNVVQVLTMGLVAVFGFLRRWIHPRCVCFRQFNDTLQLSSIGGVSVFQLFLAELLHLGAVSIHAVRGTCYPCPILELHRVRTQDLLFFLFWTMLEQSGADQAFDSARHENLLTIWSDLFSIARMRILTLA